jgi:hypothetical protein
MRLMAGLDALTQAKSVMGRKERYRHARSGPGALQWCTSNSSLPVDDGVRKSPAQCAFKKNQKTRSIPPSKAAELMKLAPELLALAVRVVERSTAALRVGAALVKSGPCLVGRTFGEPDYKLREEFARRSENL